MNKDGAFVPTEKSAKVATYTTLVIGTAAGIAGHFRYFLIFSLNKNDFLHFSSS